MNSYKNTLELDIDSFQHGMVDILEIGRALLNVGVGHDEEALVFLTFGRRFEDADWGSVVTGRKEVCAFDPAHTEVPDKVVGSHLGVGFQRR